MSSSVLSTDDNKVKVSVNSEKDALLFALSNIQVEFNSYVKINKYGLEVLLHR